MRSWQIAVNISIIAVILTNRFIMSQSSAAKNDVHYVSEKDLPLACPRPDQTLWDMHPRVYLPIAHEGEVVCPYCSAKYILKSSQS